MEILSKDQTDTAYKPSCKLAIFYCNYLCSLPTHINPPPQPKMDTNKTLLMHLPFLIASMHTWEFMLTNRHIPQGMPNGNFTTPTAFLIQVAT